MASSVEATTYPSNRNNSDEAKLEKWMEPYAADGVIWGATNQLETFADSTGMHAKLKTGSVNLNGIRGDLAAQTTLDIAAADADDDRIDSIVAELKRAPSPYTINFKVVTGVPDDDPVAPTLVNDSTYRTIRLANIAVGAGVSTITAGNVTLVREMTGVVPWTEYTPSYYPVTGGGTPVLSGGTAVARYRLDGMRCEVYWKGSISMSSASPFTGPYYGISLPIAARSDLLVVGAAAVQGVGGYVRCRRPSTNGSPAGTGGLEILRSDHDDLANDDVYRSDSFTAFYEIAAM